MRRALVGLAAAAALVAGLSPAQAVTTGGGAAAGTLACVAGTTTFVLDSPAFDFNGTVGALHMAGVTSCAQRSVLADYGFGRVAVNGPGITCDSVSAGWSWAFGELRMVVGGPCTVGDRTGSVQFVVEAVAAAGTFAGVVVVTPMF